MQSERKKKSMKKFLPLVGVVSLKTRMALTLFRGDMRRQKFRKKATKAKRKIKKNGKAI